MDFVRYCLGATPNSCTFAEHMSFVSVGKGISAVKQWAVTPMDFWVPEAELEYVYAWSLKARRIPFRAQKKTDTSYATGIEVPHFISFWNKALKVMSVSAMWGKVEGEFTPFSSGEIPARAAFVCVLGHLSPASHLCITDPAPMKVEIVNKSLVVEGVTLDEDQANRLFDLTMAFSFPGEGIVERKTTGVTLVEGVVLINTAHAKRMGRLLHGSEFEITRHSLLKTALQRKFRGVRMEIMEFASCTCEKEEKCECPEVLVALQGGRSRLSFFKGSMEEKKEQAIQWYEEGLYLLAREDAAKEQLRIKCAREVQEQEQEKRTTDLLRKAQEAEDKIPEDMRDDVPELVEWVAPPIAEAFFDQRREEKLISRPITQAVVSHSYVGVSSGLEKEKKTSLPGVSVRRLEGRVMQPFTHRPPQSSSSDSTWGISPKQELFEKGSLPQKEKKELQVRKITMWEVLATWQSQHSEIGMPIDEWEQQCCAQGIWSGLEFDRLLSLKRCSLGTRGEKVVVVTFKATADPTEVLRGISRSVEDWMFVLKHWGYALATPALFSKLRFDGKGYTSADLEAPKGSWAPPVVVYLRPGDNLKLEWGRTYFLRNDVESEEEGFLFKPESEMLEWKETISGKETRVWSMFENTLALKDWNELGKVQGKPVQREITTTQFDDALPDGSKPWMATAVLREGGTRIISKQVVSRQKDQAVRMAAALVLVAVKYRR